MCKETREGIRLTTFSQLSRRARFDMLAFHVALVDIGVKSVAEGLDATEPIDFSLSGIFARGKAVEKARQKKIIMEVDANFMFEIFPADRIIKARRKYSVQCEDGLSAAGDISMNSVSAGNIF